MFEIQQDTFLGLERYSLINSETGEYLTIIPTLGGMLHELVLSVEKELFSIIDNYQSLDELMVNSGYKSCILVPFPSRIENGKYCFDGKDYQLPVNETDKNNALHGLVYNKHFDVTRQDVNDDFAKLTMRFIYSSDIEGYPFPFEFILVYTLSSNGMELYQSVNNTGTANMPLGNGWHPYLSFNEKVDNLLLKLPVTDKIELGDNLLPTGEITPYDSFRKPKQIGDTSLDSSFVVDKNAITTTMLSSPKKNATINIWQESEKYGFLQVYIPPNRNSIAIEPVTCSANAFNTKQSIVILKPEQTFKGKAGIYMSRYITNNNIK